MVATLAPQTRRLTAHDASFLYTETPNGPMHGSTIGIFEGVIPLETLIESVASRLHLIPRYRQRLAFVPFNLHHPSWEDDPDFDIRRHIEGVQLPAGSTLEDGIRKAVEISEPLLDRSRPMWRTVLISGVLDRTLMLSMVHHCMIDGASGVELSTVLLDFEPESSEMELGPPWRPQPFPDEQSRLSDAARERALDQFTGMMRASNLMRDPARAARRALDLSRAAQAVTSTDRPVLMAPWNTAQVTRSRTLAWRKYPFALFRALRGSLGGTVNDVALTVVTEAAARYMRDEGYSVPNRYLRIMCPVNVRREGEEGALGNRVSGLFPVLPAWPMPVTERHAAVVAETTARKQRGEAQAMEVMMDEATYAPPSPIAAAVVQPLEVPSPLPNYAPPVPRYPVLPPLPAGFNFTITNVPGVQVPQYLAGRRMLDVVGTIMLGGNLGFGAVISTYNQTLYISLTAEPRLLPRVDHMAELVDAVVMEMADAAQVAVPAESVPLRNGATNGHTGPGS